MHRLLTLLLLTLAATPYADDWGAMATISSTMGVQGGRICLGEASRGDIGCPAYAPSVSPTGTLTTTAISLTTSGTNWGYLASNASYLPNLNTGAISATTLNLGGLTVTSSSLVSSTAQVAFSVQRSGGANQTVVDGAATVIDWGYKAFDTNNNFDLATDRFTPTVAGKYLVTFSAYCSPSTNYCTNNIFKNGVSVAGGHGYGANQLANVVAVIDMNGSTDYLTASVVNNGGTTIGGSSSYTFFQGFLINGSSGSGDTTPTGQIAAFDLASCPTGWSEYTPARGRFLRGIDNGAGNDPSGTRVAGNVQDDLFKSHTHLTGQAGTGSTAAGASFLRADVGDSRSTTSSGGAETRPKNVAVLYCRKD